MSELPTLGGYLRELRERRGWHQELLAKRLKVSKSLVSHFENNRRPSSKVLKKLVEILQPSLKEREMLQLICDQQNLGVNLQSGRRELNLVTQEIQDQQDFNEIFIVSRRPIELTEINDHNPFLKTMIAKLKKHSLTQDDVLPHKQYIYFTVRESLTLFGTFFHFLKKKGISQPILEATFQVVRCPSEFCLLSYAIYSSPQREGKRDEYSQVGRILLRDREDLESFRVAHMGVLEMRQVYGWLKDTYNRLRINSPTHADFELLSVRELLAHENA